MISAFRFPRPSYRFQHPATRNVPSAAASPAVESTRLPVLPLVREELFSHCREWDSLIRQYIRETPAAPSQIGAVDFDRFLGWLDLHTPVSPTEQDLLVSLQSWRTVELFSLEKHLAATRFAALRESSLSRLSLLGHEKRLQAFLNPVHMWATFGSRAFLSEDVTLPAKVLFFQSGNVVRTIVVDDQAEWLLKLLEKGPQRTFALLSELDPLSREEELRTLRELVRCGAIALA